MASSLLLYTLLALWLLPAIALVVVYCLDVLRDRMRQLIARWHCFWAERAIRRHIDAQHVVSFRQSVIVDEAAPAMRNGASPVERADSHASDPEPFSATEGHIHVPLVIEKEDGRLHLEQWSLSLN